MAVFLSLMRRSVLCPFHARKMRVSFKTAVHYAPRCYAIDSCKIIHRHGKRTVIKMNPFSIRIGRRHFPARNIFIRHPSLVTVVAVHSHRCCWITQVAWLKGNTRTNSMLIFIYIFRIIAVWPKKHHRRGVSIRDETRSKCNVRNVETKYWQV